MGPIRRIGPTGLNGHIGLGPLRKSQARLKVSSAATGGTKDGFNVLYNVLYVHAGILYKTLYKTLVFAYKTLYKTSKVLRFTYKT